MELIIERFCWFDTCKKENNVIWKHLRAPDGYMYSLVEVKVMIEKQSETHDQFFQIYDGFVHSRWGSYPNIFDQSTLGMAILQIYQPSTSISLNGWHCKELTMSWRNTSPTYNVRSATVVYYHLIKMTKAETLEYAVKQPRFKYRHGSSRTLDRFED